MGEVVCDLGKSGNTTNTTTHNSDFPAQHNRQVTTPATRCVHPSAYRTCRVAGFVPCMPWYVLLVRTWACYSESGQPRPRTEQRVNVRNRRPPYGSAGSHAGHVGVAITRGCSTNHWAAARPRRFNIHRSEVHATPKTPIFPRNKAEKSTPQQHVVSNNPDARQSATRPWLRWPPARHAPRPRTHTPASYPYPDTIGTRHPPALA